MVHEVISARGRAVHAQGIAQLAAERPHTLVFFIAAMACVILTLSPNGMRGDLARQRKIYWGGTFFASAFGFIAALPNVTTGLIVAGLCAFCLTLSAYFGTQLIKIGGRVVAFDSAEGLPADVYGSGSDPYSPQVSTTKAWWIFVVFLVLWTPMLIDYVVGREGAASALLALGMFVLLSVLLGYVDGKHRQRVARGQYLQFGVIAVISAGIFAVCYLITYSAALRWSDSTR